MVKVLTILVYLPIVCSVVMTLVSLAGMTGPSSSVHLYMKIQNLELRNVFIQPCYNISTKRRSNIKYTR